MPGSLHRERNTDGIVTLTFDRPAVRNALDWPTMEGFAAAVRDLTSIRDAPNLAPRAVILTGAGSEAFCSGGDQRALRDDTSKADGLRLATLMGDALLALERLPVPVIAAIEGHALGGGSEIALACDLRVAGAGARLGLVHGRLGLIPGWGGGQRLLRLVGYSAAMEMMLTARAYDAEALLALGLVNLVVPAGDALAAARALAADIVQLDPAVVRAVKGLSQAGLTEPYPSALATERSLFPDLWSADAHLGAMARFNNRPASERSVE